MTQQKRHIAKSITYRILATTTTVLVSWLVTGDITTGFVIGGIETVTKMALYYSHEYAWSHSNFGR